MSIKLNQGIRRIPIKDIDWNKFVLRVKFPFLRLGVHWAVPSITYVENKTLVVNDAFL